MAGDEVTECNSNFQEEGLCSQQGLERKEREGPEGGICSIWGCSSVQVETPRKQSNHCRCCTVAAPVRVSVGEVPPTRAGRGCHRWVDGDRKIDSDASWMELGRKSTGATQNLGPSSRIDVGYDWDVDVAITGSGTNGKYRSTLDTGRSSGQSARCVYLLTVPNSARYLRFLGRIPSCARPNSLVGTVPLRGLVT
jgi:hypothetical protein